MWLAANNLEPKLSPFDPLAVLDEIARLVPGYAVDRMNLLSGNDVQTETGLMRRLRRSPRGARSLPLTMDCLPPERWASTARRFRNSREHQAAQLVKIRTK